MESVRYKFRAWREDIEVMEDVRELVWDNNGLKKQTGEQFLNIVGFREFESYTGAGDLKNVVLMQFTGLTDVNGVEIYEGDIITTDIDSIRGTLIYRYGCFQVKYGHEKYESLINISYPEVIGNIYQHKHLLKENEK